MRVQELIDILRDHPADAEVELAIVAPILEDSEEITVDRFDIAGIMPWTDDDGDNVWLIAAEEDEHVEMFFDALDDQEAGD
jgi:hypothetical protein